MPKFYITTAIVYTNAPPHIGFALELVQADAIARYRRMLGDEVAFVTGTDEHGTKIMRSAQAAGLPPQEFVDRIAAQVSDLAVRLGVSNTDFIRTSDRIRHWPAAGRIWQAMATKGDLYKKTYEGYYCVGHEAFIKPSELADGLCPLHKRKPELVKEENWFFKMSAYRGKVRELIETDALRIVPFSRKAEILNLLDDAEDISFSRPSDQLPWGIPVPGDESQTMYVWTDALTNYLSALGYGTDEAGMSFWPAQIHLIGKDILRFHAMIWPAMLLSAGLALPKAVYVHGFITVDGEKMSKSLGNVIDPFALLDTQPAEVVRYYMLRELQSGEDGDFSHKNLGKRYETDLANGLGNLVQRVTTLVGSKLGGKVSYEANFEATEASLSEVLEDTEYHTAFEQFRLHDAVGQIWVKIGIANAYLNDRQPWKTEGESCRQTLSVAAGMLVHIAWLLQPFMTATAEKIGQRFGVKTLTRTLTDGQVCEVIQGEPLFPRKERH